DFSASSDAALEWAQALGQAFGARLILLHVVDTTASGLMGGPGGVLMPPPPQALLDDLRAEAKTSMAALAARVPGAETRIVEGSPRQEILRAAAEMKADLIVMGTHGRSGLAHLLFGSVAEHVVRHASVPVFTIRRTGAA
ncbi:MAG: universal stress protein, partial [Armatimonadota bacterium]|nr:universal stress protein [Armatimonadota bacterium]